MEEYDIGETVINIIFIVGGCIFFGLLLYATFRRFRRWWLERKKLYPKLRQQLLDDIRQARSYGLNRGLTGGMRELIWRMAREATFTVDTAGQLLQILKEMWTAHHALSLSDIATMFQELDDPEKQNNRQYFSIDALTNNNYTYLIRARLMVFLVQEACREFKIAWYPSEPAKHEVLEEGASRYEVLEEPELPTPPKTHVLEE